MFDLVLVKARRSPLRYLQQRTTKYVSTHAFHHRWNTSPNGRLSFPTERPRGYPISELEQSTRVIHFNVGQADAMLLVHRGSRYFLTAVRPWKIRNESEGHSKPPSKLTGKRHIDYVVIHITTKTI